MTPEERVALINRLDRSFAALPNWAKAATKHALAAPKTNPRTGLPFTSFREVVTVACDETLMTLKEDFEDNDDLLPADPSDNIPHPEETP